MMVHDLPVDHPLRVGWGRDEANPILFFRMVLAKVSEAHGDIDEFLDLASGDYRTAEVNGYKLIIGVAMKEDSDECIATAVVHGPEWWCVERRERWQTYRWSAEAPTKAQYIALKLAL